MTFLIIHCKFISNKNFKLIADWKTKGPFVPKELEGFFYLFIPSKSLCFVGINNYSLEVMVKNTLAVTFSLQDEYDALNNKFSRNYALSLIGQPKALAAKGAID
ncbi:MULTISPECIES: hypothetical protein [unclassified Cytobacillus]|uniref:hypothetical protein n=1 Tax=unclassified Cytobacillus TaxID=2675268 RepID=UPI001357A3A9|nr:hypothetical protein [Cytobacillus sp. AMY 15.2]